MTEKSIMTYYNPYITKNGDLTNIPFNNFLSYIFTIPSNNRFKKIEKIGEFSFIKQKLSSEMKYASDKAICIADYRVRKPKEGAKGTDLFQEISSDVLESTNCFYQHTENLFLMEYNHYGAKINNIKHYFKEFLPKFEKENDVKWDIEFKEILPDVSFKDVLNSKEIKSLEIKFDLTSTQINYFKESAVTKYKKSIGEEIVDIHLPKQLNSDEEIFRQMDKTLKDIIHSRRIFGGGTYSMYMGGGKKWRKNPIDTPSTKSFLSMIDLDSSLYSSIKVAYIPENGGEIKNLDLKNSKVMHSEITLEGDAFETVTSSMESYFYEKSNRKGAAKYKLNTITEMIPESDWPFSFSNLATV